ncbi:kininogen-1 [Parus major]|uniref:kininogen-1 n=1 Tax=Parus major TaxID=9157 RepID=UPI0007715182|nr:kininogen-1 [Parus major]
MKAFIVLALCCSFFSSRAIPLAFESLDCDDPDVFKAVDAALKKFNGDRTTGNQFALYMVMEAKRTAGPDPEFYVKYRILESNCTTEENKHWQDCQYKVSAEAVSICSLYEFSVQKHQHNDQDCNCLGKNTVEELAFLAASLLQGYMSTLQKCLQSQS